MRSGVPCCLIFSSRIGRPPTVLEGDLANLDSPDTVFLEVSDGKSLPGFGVGDVVLIGGRRARFIGTCRVRTGLDGRALFYTSIENLRRVLSLKSSAGLRRAGFERRIQFAFDAEFHLTKLVADIRSMGPGPVDRVIGKARDDVPVAMVDGLAGGLAIVDDHIEPVGTRRGPDCPAQTRQQRADGSGHRIGNLAQLSVMRPGHHQGMAAIDRIDVKKRHYLSRLKHFGRGDRTVSDLAENAVRIVWSMAHDTTLPRRKQACFGTG
jgi:hypothetical protein